MPIEPSRIPAGTFFDTSSLIDVLLGKNQKEWNADRTKEAVLARELFSEVILKRGQGVSSSVALAEIMRKGNLKDPHFSGLVFQPFDNECSRVLGQHFPANVSSIRETGETAAAVKFDTLIITTALRFAPKWPFITADANQVRRASRVGLDAYLPSFFAAPQQDLFEVAAATDNE